MNYHLKLDSSLILHKKLKQSFYPGSRYKYNNQSFLYITLLYYKQERIAMSRIKLIDNQIIQIVNRKSPLNPDQVKGMMEILGLSILEIENRQRRQEVIGEVFRTSLKNIERGLGQVEEESRSRDRNNFREAEMMINEIKRNLEFQAKEGLQMKEVVQNLQREVANEKQQEEEKRQEEARKQENEKQQQKKQMQLIQQEVKQINKVIEESVQKIKSLESECQILKTIEEQRKQQEQQQKEQIKFLQQEVKLINKVPSIHEMKKEEQLKENVIKAAGAEDWESLKKKKSLDLEDKQLSGLPQSFGQLTQLTTLYLQCNPLGQFPECILQLHNLTHFYIQNAKLERLPDNFGQKLPNLLVLFIFNNRLRRLPSSLNKLQKLVQLYMTVEPDSEFGLSQIPLLPNLSQLWIHLKKKTSQQEKQDFENKCKNRKIDFQWYTWN